MKYLIWSLILRAHLAYPDIVFRQALLETGSFTSELCVKHHNLFGIKQRDHYAHFQNDESCVEFYATHIALRYKGGSYYNFLKKIGYATDRRYIAKLKALKVKTMKYAVIVDSTSFGPLAYIPSLKLVAPISGMVIAMCCGEPTNSGTSIDANGKMVHGLKCCGFPHYHQLVIGNKVNGELVEGTFVVADLVDESTNEDLPGNTSVEGSDDLFD